MNRFKPVRKEDVQEHIDKAFERADGCLYPLMETPVDSMIRHFGPQTSKIADRVGNVVHAAEHLLILEAGCGDGTGLKTLVNDTQRFKKIGTTTGIGISAGLKHVRASEHSPERELPFLESIRNAFQDKTWKVMQGCEETAHIGYVQSDVYEFFSKLPELAHLIIADHLFEHLALPWLALTLLVKKLTPQGLAIIGNFRRSALDERGGGVPWEEMLGHLRALNPSHEFFYQQSNGNLCIQKKGDTTPFSSGIVLAADRMAPRIKIEEVLLQSGPENFLPIDEWSGK